MIIGGAIFAGGAATLITASAHTFGTPATTPIVTGGNVVGSAVLSDSALMASDVTKDRWVDFFLWGPGNSTCSASVAPALFTESDHPAVDGVSTVTTVGSYKPTQVGTYQWTADIRDPSTNAIEAGPTTCGAEPASIVAASPAIATNPSSGGAVGTVLHDTATVTGGSSPIGTVIFTLYPNSASCTAGTGALYTSPAEALSTTAPLTATSGSFPSTGVGTYQWVAKYISGNSNNKDATSACGSEPVTISQSAPSIATTAGAGGTTVPVDVTDSATLTGGSSPTGSITFTLYPDTASCTAGTGAVFTSAAIPLPASAPFTVASGNAHLAVAGTYQWLAKYSGDTNNASVSSTCGAEPVTTGGSGVSAITTPGGSGVQAITTPGTGSTGSLTGITVGGFLLLGGLGFALMGVLVPRRRRSQ